MLSWTEAVPCARKDANCPFAAPLAVARLTLPASAAFARTFALAPRVGHQLKLSLSYAQVRLPWKWEWGQLTRGSIRSGTLAAKCDRSIVPLPRSRTLSEGLCSSPCCALLASFLHLSTQPPVRHPTAHPTNPLLIQNAHSDSIPPAAPRPNTRRPRRTATPLTPPDSERPP